jgi:hypothetical protein
MAANPRTKGKRAEYAARDILQEISNLVAAELGVEPIKIDRNLTQTRGGGYDLVGTFACAMEIKHHENLQLNQWWEQAVRQAQPTGMIPVLMYKQNNKPWRVQMNLLHVVNEVQIRARSDISLDVFKVIFRYECIKGYKELYNV